jgi:hypothetical protein
MAETERNGKAAIPAAIILAWCSPQLFPKSVTSVKGLAHENNTRAMLDLFNQH